MTQKSCVELWQTLDLFIASIGMRLVLLDLDDIVF